MSVEYIVLDSTVAVAHLRARCDVRQFIVRGYKLLLPVVALGELWHGVLKASNPSKERAKLLGLLKLVDVVYPDFGTAESYATLIRQLEVVGRPIPTNDVWIAAMAVQLLLPLVTRDAHFERISGLRLIYL